MANQLETYLFILIMFAATVGAQVCNQTFHEKDLFMEEKFDWLSSNCHIRILPSPLYAIEIQFTAPSTVHLWQLVPSGNQTVELFREEYNRSQHATVQAQTNTGLHITWGFDNFTFRRQPYEIRIQRFIEIASFCGKVDHTIGDKLQSLQPFPVLKSPVKSCLYQLLPGNSGNETLYLFKQNEDIDVRFVDHASFKSMHFDHMRLENWRGPLYLMVLFNSPLVNPNFTVSAVSTIDTCKCGQRQHVLHPETELSVFRSPSLPEFVCPGEICIVEVDIMPGNVPRGYTPKLLVSFNQHHSEGMSMQFFSGFAEFTLKEIFPTSFLLDTEKLTAIYQGPLGYTNGFLEMSVKTVLVQDDCDCSTFSERNFARSHQLKIKIPAHCELMFCHWNVHVPNAITEDHSAYVIEVSLTNGGLKDEIELLGTDLRVRYDHNDLKWPRIVYMILSENVNIMFWREAIGPEATLELSWKNIQGSDLKPEAVFNITTQPTTVASPYFPHPHLYPLTLSYLFKAPKNHKVVVHLEELDIDSIHHYMVFHDGYLENSTEIKYLTGLHANLTIESSGEYLLVKSVSDDFAFGKGYHMNVFAAPLPSPNKKNTGTSIKTFIYDNRPSSTMIIYIFTMLLSFFIISCYIVRSNVFGLFNTWENSENSVVQFSSSDDSVTVTTSQLP